jgi:hypothetical protein
MIEDARTGSAFSEVAMFELFGEEGSLSLSTCSFSFLTTGLV